MPCNSNKVVVNLSYDCLKKMANDPEFAKEIEWNLSGEVAANSQVYSFAKRDGVELGGRTVTYDANGNRQSSCGGMRTANSSNILHLFFVSHAFSLSILLAHVFCPVYFLLLFVDFVYSIHLNFYLTN